MGKINIGLLDFRDTEDLLKKFDNLIKCFEKRYGSVRGISLGKLRQLLFLEKEELWEKYGDHSDEENETEIKNKQLN
jgi:hypothetical protein